MIEEHVAHENQEKEHIVLVASALLASQPFEITTLAAVATTAALPLESVAVLFPTMHELGVEILTREGASMRQAQHVATQNTADPLARLKEAFRLVGENLATEPVVRAGVRIAAESSHCFPERKINPFRTWDRFVSSNLAEAAAADMVRTGVNVADASWLLVAAGIGTKDLLAFTATWNEAPRRLEQMASLVISTIAAARDPEMPIDGASL